MRFWELPIGKEFVFQGTKTPHIKTARDQVRVHGNFETVVLLNAEVEPLYVPIRDSFSVLALLNRRDESGRVRFTISVPLEDLITCDGDAFNEYIDSLALPPSEHPDHGKVELTLDSCQVVGWVPTDNPNGYHGEVLIEVTARVETDIDLDGSGNYPDD